MVSLDPKTVRMPELGSGEWLNTPHPLDKAALRGKVALIDFWDYTCVNCIRTLPYLKAWYERYADYGLVIIGVHAPEFAFARSSNQIVEAIERFELDYPILLDNHYQTWDRFANKAWPTKYLIDPDGYVRFKKQGEGAYPQFEMAIQRVLEAINPGVRFPEALPLLREEDAEGAVCYPATPELYAGHITGNLGNRRGYGGLNVPTVYQMPLQRSERAFYVDGIWRATEEAFAYAGQSGGEIVLPYRAVGVNAVLSPSSDPVEVMLNLRPDEAFPMVEVKQDGYYLTPDIAGEDIQYDDGGLSYIEVDQARMYELVVNPGFEKHELSLTFHAGGLALYSFTFTSCVNPNQHAE